MLTTTTTPDLRSRSHSPNRDESISTLQPIRTPQKSRSPKARSLSDSTPHLEPSPKFLEPLRTSKDDHTIASPRTPRRPELLSRGLSLQMPTRDTPMHSPAHYAVRVPLSPQLDARNTYAVGGGASLLPRRSRGAEFSRACTNLHHSTLVDQSSPDSSPTITQKGVMIPGRKPRGMSNSMVLDSPSGVMHGGWGHGDRMAASSSVGSINMLGSDDSSGSDDEGDPMDPDGDDDPMLMTPQAMRNSTPFGGPIAGNNTGMWSNMFSPGGMPTFMSIQRARLRKGRSRKSSSSASGHSSMASPGPASPPNGKGEGFFARDAAIRKAGSGSRRESLSLFTHDLHISSGNDSGDEGTAMPQTPGVVRRPVTRRGNLLPKSRQFGRIKAELLEESTPIDNEFRREAEIIRQVRESDVDLEFPSGTAQSSPTLLPTVPGLDGPLEGVQEEESESNMSIDSSTTKGLFGIFGAPRNSMSKRDFWNRDPPAHTPPPPPFPRAGSSVMSEDASMDSPTVSSTSTSLPSANATAGSDHNSHSRRVSRSSTPQPFAPLTAADGLKKSSKRRRDDDLDHHSIKRRAVSPGVSVQNSPVLSQSPVQRGENLWGLPAKTNRENSTGSHANGERSNSGSNIALTPSLGPKRVGLQSMTDTHDGLMKMSIE